MQSKQSIEKHVLFLFISLSLTSFLFYPFYLLLSLVTFFFNFRRKSFRNQSISPFLSPPTSPHLLLSRFSHINITTISVIPPFNSSFTVSCSLTHHTHLKWSRPFRMLVATPQEGEGASELHTSGTEDGVVDEKGYVRHQQHY